MEMTEPTEKFNIFARPKDSDRLMDPRVVDENATATSASYYGGMVDKTRKPITAWTRPLWMKEALKRTSLNDPTSTYRFQYARPLAENVIALIILPKLAIRDRVISGTKTRDPEVLELAPSYEYDSWRILDGKTIPHPTINTEQLDNTARDNLLPPIVQLTMVAIDEPTSVRMDLKMTDKPKWTENLFPRTGVPVNRVSVHEDNMERFEKALREDPDHPNINYRIFTTDVVIRGSKWSRDPN
jgi:uncharacterized protein (TIGR02599 family)